MECPDDFLLVTIDNLVAIFPKVVALAPDGFVGLLLDYLEVPGSA